MVPIYFDTDVLYLLREYYEDEVYTLFGVRALSRPFDKFKVNISSSAPRVHALSNHIRPQSGFDVAVDTYKCEHILVKLGNYMFFFGIGLK